MTSRLRLAAAFAALTLASGTARADAIDGDWCLVSTHFSIDGPRITTPGGSRIEGQYSRHGFVYVVPAAESGAGSRIDMELLNEETVRLTRTPPGAGASPPEIWKRCKPIS